GCGRRGGGRSVGGRPHARIADAAHDLGRGRPAPVRRGPVRALEPAASADPPAPLGHAGAAPPAGARRARDRDPAPRPALVPPGGGPPPAAARSVRAAGGRLDARPRAPT